MELIKTAPILGIAPRLATGARDAAAGGPRPGDPRRRAEIDAAAGAGSIVMGLGMGFFSTAAIVMVQDSVGWAERGVATASNIFARNLGSTLGAAFLGALLNKNLAGAGAATFERVRRLLDGGRASLSDAPTRQLLAHALHGTFEGVFALAAITLALGLAVPAVAFGARRAAVVAEEG